MCGIACVFGAENAGFEQNAIHLLHHRGPNDNGIYKSGNIAFIHTRLSILELSYAGHQPMFSSCGRHVISYNGEIYNHKDLRRKYLPDFKFKGDSDTETVVELFRLLQEKMLPELVGMWSMFIWDTVDKRLFISRDRFGQKPLYYRKKDVTWLFSSEIKPLLVDDERREYEPAAVIDFLALGNYGHLGDKTFYKNIKQFPPGAYAWHTQDSESLNINKYWVLPNIKPGDKKPFDESLKKELHDKVVEAVLSQTLSDVPIGITLSGGIDSSIIAGVIATYYDKNVSVFTAQSVGSKYDESRYVDAFIEKYPHVDVHKHDLKKLSIKDDIYKYLNIQEEPFGDPSIIGHGLLMNIAAENGIKVVLGGQGADELFFGYTNMLHAILLKQIRRMDMSGFISNIKNADLDKPFILRTFLLSLLPGIEKKLRARSRVKRRYFLSDNLAGKKNDTFFEIPNYSDFYDVWLESIYGIHLPHLVHYDDRNAMAYSIEGRMPFLDHRIAECVATIQPSYFLKDGLRKYPLREACGEYLPQIIKERKDKIGFYTPLIDAMYKDTAWVSKNINEFSWIETDVKSNLLNQLSLHKLSINEALLLWRFVITNCWKQQFNIKD
jgi:asparagine synthase (glutamine-hydrolysing)